MATHRLTFYLMNDDVAEFNEALAPGKSSQEIEVAAATDIDGRFHRVTPRPRTPGWVSYVQPILSESLGDIRTASASGLQIGRASCRERV